MVESHIILNMQAPNKEEITGIREWPIPRIELANPSIIPHK